MPLSNPSSMTSPPMTWYTGWLGTRGDARVLEATRGQDPAGVQGRGLPWDGLGQQVGASSKATRDTKMVPLWGPGPLSEG